MLRCEIPKACRWPVLAAASLLDLRGETPNAIREWALGPGCARAVAAPTDEPESCSLERPAYYAHPSAHFTAEPWRLDQDVLSWEMIDMRLPHILCDFPFENCSHARGVRIRHRCRCFERTNRSIGRPFGGDHFLPIRVSTNRRDQKKSYRQNKRINLVVVIGTCASKSGLTANFTFIL